MEKYCNNGKEYDVEEVNLDGAIINVNGTSITDQEMMSDLTNSSYRMSGYTVFINSDEICFDTFDEAYQCAMYRQKDTFWLED